METWKLLLIVGIIILIAYFYFNRKENFIDIIGEPLNKYVEKIFEQSNQIPSYPIDLDRKEYMNNINVKLNRIFSDMVELNNKHFAYPIIFNNALKPVEHSNETNKPNQINTLIKYLEDKFNTYDSNWEIKVQSVKKILKHLIDNQLQYDILLNIEVNVKDLNRNIQKYNRDIFMTVIINKYIGGQNQSEYATYIKSLSVSNMDHYQYLTGLEKQLNLEKIDMSINSVVGKKKSENQKEMDNLTNVFDPKYPEYSIYEGFDANESSTNADIFLPSNTISKYSNCNTSDVNTEDVLDIFQ